MAIQSSAALQTLLNRIHRKSYPAYKETKGIYQFDRYVLSIDHVQGDPFASPSKVSIRVLGKDARFPSILYDSYEKRIALQDYLTRKFHQGIDRYNFKAKGSGKSGLLSISQCRQEILERTACTIHPKNGEIVLRMEIGFPANGRTINAQELIRILFDFLPDCVYNTLFYAKLNHQKLQQIHDLAEDQAYIRHELKRRNLVAFVANGSVLPRESGISPRPLKDAVPFSSPASLEVTMSLPHKGELIGMGIPKGITLIVGGGYHGKSTLLNALELGVYNHIAGDGREYVITDDTAVKLRAEDGRSIKHTDISMFINNLPNGKDTVSFYTEDASGSTSQAANVIEAMETGSSLFLIDEDTSATNFMIRDELMQRVVNRNKEPITPFIERARMLFEQYGISSIIVAGSSGSYFHIADLILQMNQYVPFDITDFAKQEAKAFPLPDYDHLAVPDIPDYKRIPKPNSAFRSQGKCKVKTLGKDAVQINRETIDLRYVEQLADSEQTTALGYIIKYLESNAIDGKKNLQTLVDNLYQTFEQNGISNIAPNTNMALPRRQEIFAALNRYRSLKL